MLIKSVILVVNLVAGSLFGFFLASQTSSSVSLEQSEATVRMEGEKKLGVMKRNMGQKMFNLRFEIAGVRDGYKWLLDEMEAFEDSARKTYAVDKDNLSMLRIKAIAMPRHRLHPDLVGLLRINSIEKKKVETILKTAFMHMAVKERRDATIEASDNPNEVIVNVKRAPYYGEEAHGDR